MRMAAPKPGISSLIASHLRRGEAARPVGRQGDRGAGAQRVQRAVEREGQDEAEIVGGAGGVDLGQDRVAVHPLAPLQPIAGQPHDVLGLGGGGICGGGLPGGQHRLVDRAGARDLAPGAVAVLLPLPAAVTGPEQPERLHLRMQGGGREIGPPQRNAGGQQAVGEAAGDILHHPGHQRLVAQPAPQPGQGGGGRGGQGVGLIGHATARAPPARRGRRATARPAGSPARAARSRNRGRCRGRRRTPAAPRNGRPARPP